MGSTFSGGGIVWSPDSKYLAFNPSTFIYSAQGQSTGTAQVWVWDATTGKTLHLYTLTGPNASVYTYWSPNSKYLAFTPSTNSAQGQSTNTAQLWVWNATTGKTLLLYTLTRLNPSVGIYWSSNDKYLAFTTHTNPGQGQSPNTVQLWLWDATTGKTLLLYTLTRLNPSVGNAFWSPDSKHLTFVPEWGKSTSTVQVWVWDATTGKILLLYTFTSPFPNVGITWSPNEKYLAFTPSTNSAQGQSTNTTQLWVWDATTGKTFPLYSFTGPFASVGSIAWSSNEKFLAFNTYTSTYPGQVQTTTTAQLWVWNATTGKTLLLYTLTYTNASATTVVWSPDSTHFAFNTSTSTTNPAQGQSTGTAQVWVWDATSGKTLPIYTGSNSSVGSTSYGGGVVWSPTDGKHLTFFTNSTDPSCQTISHSSSCNGTVRIWDDTTKGSMYVLPLGPSTVTTMDLSPDGTRIATGSEDGTVYVLYVV